MVDGPCEESGPVPLMHVAFVAPGETRRSPRDGGVAKASCLPKECLCEVAKSSEKPIKENGREFIAIEPLKTSGTDRPVALESPNTLPLFALSIVLDDDNEC